jgi:hypothetical protein
MLLRLDQHSHNNITNVVSPTGIVVDSIGNIYVASPFVGEMRKYSPSKNQI